MERLLHPFWRRSSYRNCLAHDALDLTQRCLREMDVTRRGGLCELFRGAGSDNGHINRWLRLVPSQHPRNSQLRHGHPFSLCQVPQLLDDRQIALEDVTVEDLALAAPIIRREGRLRRECSG